MCACVLFFLISSASGALNDFQPAYELRQQRKSRRKTKIVIGDTQSTSTTTAKRDRHIHGIKATCSNTSTHINSRAQNSRGGSKIYLSIYLSTFFPLPFLTESNIYKNIKMYIKTPTTNSNNQPESRADRFWMIVQKNIYFFTFLRMRCETHMRIVYSSCNDPFLYTFMLCAVSSQRHLCFFSIKNCISTQIQTIFKDQNLYTNTFIDDDFLSVRKLENEDDIFLMSKNTNQTHYAHTSTHNEHMLS